MKHRKTIFKGYQYRRYAALLWLATAAWIGLETATVILNIGDVPDAVLALGLLIAGGTTLGTLAMRYSARARGEFERIQPLLGVVHPLESRRDK
jgi:hypothetical protein